MFDDFGRVFEQAVATKHHEKSKGEGSPQCHHVSPRIGRPKKKGLLLMEEIRIATWDVKTLLNNETFHGINYLSTGRGFLPSTVLTYLPGESDWMN